MAKVKGKRPASNPQVMRFTIDRPGKNPQIIVGSQVNDLTVVAEAPAIYWGDRKRRCWHCQCVCGKILTVEHSNLRSGNTKSCGCRHEQHHSSYTPEYRVYKTMFRRCYDPRCKEYPRWGGRGIMICERWRESFANFIADMGRRPSPDHSLDRIDNNLSYSAENCRWATDAEQSRNKRTNRLITFRGETKTLVEWSEHLGISRCTLAARLDNLGWDIEAAFTRPLRHNKRR